MKAKEYYPGKKQQDEGYQGKVSVQVIDDSDDLVIDVNHSRSKGRDFFNITGDRFVKGDTQYDSFWAHGIHGKLRGDLTAAAKASYEAYKATQTS